MPNAQSLKQHLYAVALVLACFICVSPKITATERQIPPDIPRDQGIAEIVRLLAVYGCVCQRDGQVSAEEGAAIAVDVLDLKQKLAVTYARPLPEAARAGLLAQGYATLDISPHKNTWSLRTELYEKLHEARPAYCAGVEILARKEVAGYDTYHAIGELVRLKEPTPLIAKLDRDFGENPGVDEEVITAIGEVGASAAQGLLLKLFTMVEEPGNNLDLRLRHALAQIHGVETERQLVTWADIAWDQAEEPPKVASRALELLGRMNHPKAKAIALAFVATNKKEHHFRFRGDLMSRVLSNYSDRDARDALIRQLERSAPEDPPLDALEALMHYDFETPPRILVDIFNARSNHPQQLYAAFCLARAGSHLPEEWLKQMAFGGSNTHVNALAAGALVRLGNPAGVPLIRAAASRYAREDHNRFKWNHPYMKRCQLILSCLDKVMILAAPVPKGDAIQTDGQHAPP